MIVNKYTKGGGGGYVLPTATDTRLGGIKVGAGLDIDSGGTLSVSGGTGGGGDYIVTDALSSITNPTSGMVAYVPFHYEDRGAVKAIYELNDPTQYKEFYDTYICTFNYMGNGLSNYMNYNYNPSEPENSWYSIHGWESDEVHYQSDNWVSWDREGFAKCRVLSGGTIEFIVDTASTITDLTFNDIDDFTKTVSTGLTPVAGRTYIYFDGQWLIKDIEIREQKVSEYIPSLLYMANNDGIRDIFTISILNTIMTGYEFTPNNGGSVKVVGISTDGDSDSQRCRVIFEKNGDYNNTWYISTMSRTGMNPDLSGYQKKHWVTTPYHAQFLFDYEEPENGIFEYKYRTPLPGNQPQTGQTYSDIWFTVPGMVTIGDASITITSGGTDYSITNWEGLMIDGQNYNPEDTLPIDITWDYDGVAKCLHIHGNLEVSSLPDSPSESTTTFEPLPAAYYLKATKIDNSADIHELTPVTIPSLIIHEDMTQEEMAAVRNEIVNHLWQEYYVGSRQFIMAINQDSHLPISFTYHANSGGNEMIVIRGSEVTATIKKNITTGVYSIDVVH